MLSKLMVYAPFGQNVEASKGASKTYSLQIILARLVYKQVPGAPRGGLSKLQSPPSGRSSNAHEFGRIAPAAMAGGGAQTGLMS